MTQAMTVDDQQQRELEILRDYCHALIEIADLERLWKAANMMTDGLRNCGNRELEILRKAIVSLVDVVDDRRVKRVAQAIVDCKNAEKLKDQKLYEDWRKLAAEGYMPPIQ
jgi:hypothetical protein